MLTWKNTFCKNYMEQDFQGWLTEKEINMNNLGILNYAKDDENFSMPLLQVR